LIRAFKSVIYVLKEPMVVIASATLSSADYILLSKSAMDDSQSALLSSYNLSSAFY